MGKRQRLTQFIGTTDQEIVRLANDPNTSKDLRAKAVTEGKYRGLRDIQKRTKGKK